MTNRTNDVRGLMPELYDWCTTMGNLAQLDGQKVKWRGMDFEIDGFYLINNKIQVHLLAPSHNWGMTAPIEDIDNYTFKAIKYKDNVYTVGEKIFVPSTANWEIAINWEGGPATIKSIGIYWDSCLGYRWTIRTSELDALDEYGHRIPITLDSIIGG